MPCLAQYCHVDLTRSDSDHFPLGLLVDLPYIAGHQPALTGCSLASVHWQPALRDAYATSLTSLISLHPDLRPALPSSSGGLDTAVALLSAAVLRAASLAGMPAKVPKSSYRKHAPFYDHECLVSKRRVRDALQQALGRDVVREREREYHSLVRIKRRTYKARQLKHLLHTYGSNPRAFWKRLKGLGTQLPPALLDVSVWSAYLHNLCNLPPLGSMSLPAGGFPVRPTAPCSSLNALITHDELVNTLTKQHTGKASGPSGLISELFRYARLTPTKEVPNPPYLLNQGLLALLNSAFTMGYVPPAVNVSLVTPIFKRGGPLSLW